MTNYTKLSLQELFAIIIPSLYMGDKNPYSLKQIINTSLKFHREWPFIQELGIS